MVLVSFVLALVLLGHHVNAYTWPNPRMEALDGIRYEQAGVAGQQFGGVSQVCTTDGFIGPDGPDAGRINAADWLRTAFHDMATHDVVKGTGGLDASIQFKEEQTRPENPGDGFSNTIAFVEVFTGPYVSLADAIALGAVIAVESCGGDYIPFRGGRVDATKPGPPGVPEPADTLEKHTRDFSRLGFTPKEMIQLIACGHTLGGVQQKFFPDIVKDAQTANNTSGNKVFDTTSAVFDNKIATNYVSGKSVDPLTVGPNVTTNMDARIFASDRNVTMKEFAASNVLFKRTCSMLFARMLDTVPRGVMLTEEVLPLPAKPQGLVISRNLNGTFTVTTSVRLWNTQEDPSRIVKFIWAGSSGKPRGSYSMAHDSQEDFSIFPPGNVPSMFYNLPGSTGNLRSRADSQPSVLMPNDTTKFWFEVTERGRKKVYDQNGVGFPIGPTSVLLAEGSCILVVAQQDGSLGETLLVQVAVTKETKPSSVSATFTPALVGRDRQPFVVPAVLNKTSSASNPLFDFWTVTLDGAATVSSTASFKLSAVVKGQTITSNSANIGTFSLPLCPNSVLPGASNDDD